MVLGDTLSSSAASETVGHSSPPILTLTHSAYPRRLGSCGLVTLQYPPSTLRILSIQGIPRIPRKDVLGRKLEVETESLDQLRRSSGENV